MSGSLTWYLVRSTGIVAYGLLAGSMLWGLWLSTRTPSRRGRAWLLEVHRALSALAVLFTVGHLAALVADSWLEFGPTELLVPFASGWEPAAVAAGVVALYLLLAVEVTSLLRRTLARRHWRAVHLASFGAYLLATGHFLAAGTDAGNPLLFALVGGAFGVVTIGAAFRAATAGSSVAPPTTPPPPARPARPTPAPTGPPPAAPVATVPVPVPVRVPAPVPPDPSREELPWSPPPVPVPPSASPAVPSPSVPVRSHSLVP